MEKNFDKKILENILGKKMLEKNFETNILEKSFVKKNVGKINYKTKILITKIYCNIDKCQTIFALLAPFDKTGRKTRSKENICGIWLKMSRARIGRKECGDLNKVGRKDISRRLVSCR